MVQLVNGFSCHNPAQVALAKRGIDPATAKPAAGAAPGPAHAASQAAGQPAATGRDPAPATDSSRIGRGRFIDLIA